MLKKFLNVRLVQTRLNSVCNPSQSSGLYHKSLFKFSESNEDSDKPNKNEKGRDSEQGHKRERLFKDRQEKPKNVEEKEFAPQILEPKQKETHQKGRDDYQKSKEKHLKGKERQKERAPRHEDQSKSDAPQKRQFFQFGGKKPERTEAREEEERVPHKGPFDFLGEKSKQKMWKGESEAVEEREEREGFRQDVEEYETLTELIRQREHEQEGERGERRERRDQRDRGKPKPMRIFGRRDFEPGYLLEKMGIGLKAEVDHAPAELTPENRNAISARISSLRQLENNPKKYEALMELYLILEEPENVQQAYLEAQELNINKTVMIENLMFDACLRDSYTKAKEFYLYLKDNNKLEEIFNANMNTFIEEQVANEYFEELANTLKELKLVNFNLGSLDISIFNDFFGFGSITDKNQFDTNFSSRKELEFLRKSEIFVDYLREILKRRPSQIESFSHLFKFKIFFGILNDLHYPKLKLDSNGLDICMNFLEVLANSHLITPKFVEFKDVARWMAPYFQLPDSLRRIHDITKGIPDGTDFFSHFLKEFNHYVAIQGESPFDVQTVRDLYAFLKEEADKSKRTVNVETLRVILEVAQSHKQYDIIFDAYENYGKLVQSKESPLFLYIYMTNAFTYLNLSTKNCYQIISNLTEEYTTQYNQFPRALETILKTKALIKDGKYEEAHSLFNNEVLRDIIPTFQKTLVFSVLAVLFVPLRDFETRKAREETAEVLLNIKKFVNSLSENDYHEMFSKLQNDNIFIQELTGNTDIDAHIAQWQKIDDNPKETIARLNAMKERCEIETQKIVKQKINEFRIQRKKWRLIDEGKEDEHDEEAQKMLLDSNWKEVEIDSSTLNKQDVTSILARAKLQQEEIKAIMRLPLETKTHRRSLTLSSTKEEYTKPLIDLVNELIIWGVYNNEPLGKIITYNICLYL